MSRNVRWYGIQSKNAGSRSLQQLKQAAAEVAGGLEITNQGTNCEAGMRWRLTAGEVRPSRRGLRCTRRYFCRMYSDFISLSRCA
jgi:hypothetical protein